MYRILIIFYFIFCSINIAQATNWKNIENNLYYDTETIEYTENGVRLWLKNNKDKNYIISLVFLNLIERKLTTEQNYLYNKNDELISYDKNDYTERIIPDTISESLYHYFNKNQTGKNNKNLININSNTNGIDFTPYMNDLQRRIKLNWNPPIKNKNIEVVLLFKINKNGQLLSCRVSKSSGVSSFDQAAINAVKVTAPFRPLPKEYKDTSLDIKFSFNVNTYK